MELSSVIRIVGLIRQITLDGDDYHAYYNAPDGIIFEEGKSTGINGHDIQTIVHYQYEPGTCRCAVMGIHRIHKDDEVMFSAESTMFLTGYRGQSSITVTVKDGIDLERILTSN